MSAAERAGLPRRHTRRAVLWGGLTLGAAAVTGIPAARAHNVGYEAMLMKCIDPRFTTHAWNYMTGRGLQNNYSEFAIAGGPVGVEAPLFADWRETFWDNLAISVDLHKLTRVIGMAHRDCGAAAAAFGAHIRTDRGYETAVLSDALRAFRTNVGQRQPHLAVELGIMDLNGVVEPVH